ncbi:MAG: hypothetical protein HZB39_08280 [Planctomycetes bacterium]|nr:hypothetical protein [Planctomycetota bacterium]
MNLHALSIAAALGMAAAQLVAQRAEVLPDTGPPPTRFELAPDGHVVVIPCPGSTKADSSCPFEDVSEVFRAVRDDDEAPWWQLLFLGGSDLTDAVDAVRFFERLVEFDGSRLLARLRQRDLPAGLEPRAIALQRRLAVHALADLGFKPALGSLEAIGGDASIDAPLRRAVEDGIASLRGLPLPHRDADLSPLDEILAAAPARHDLLIVVDRWRMPSGRRFLAEIRSAQFRVLHAVHFDGSGRAADPETQARIQSVTERFGLVAYEAARCFGDPRVDRVALALDLDHSLACVARAWVVLEGRFDLAAIGPGLPSPPLQLRFALDRGVSVTIDATRAVITNVASDAPRLGLDAARALVASMPDAPFRGVVARLPWNDATAFPPASFGLTLHPVGETAASVVVRGAEHTALRAWLARHARGPQFETLVRSLRLTSSAGELRITVPRGAVDPGALLLEICARR